MTGRSPLQAGGVVAVVALLLAAAVQVQAVREARFPLPDVVDDSLEISSGTAVRHLSVAYQALAADLYWIRTVQYFGGTKRALAAEALMPAPPPLIAADSGAYGLLYPLLDLTTTLDPRFNIAYRFGAIFLAEPYPGGPGRPDLAIALLQKGLRERPDKWEYMQDIGFVYYWWVHDYEAAARWFNKATEVPGAPWWLRSLAATTLAQGGDRQSSRAMWTAIRESAEVDWLRRDADRRLAQLRAFDQIDNLQRVVDAYTKREGEPPADWQTLVRARIFRGIPIDPMGVPYMLDSDGRVHVSYSSPLYPMPEEPMRIGGAS